MLKLFFRNPMHGTYVEDGVHKAYEIRSFTCPALREGQAPPEAGLIANFGKSLVDEAGEPIPADTLRQYDLEKGLTDVLKAAWS